MPLISRLLPALLLPFSLVLAGCTPRGLDLTVLHTNDVHAAYGGLTAEGKPCYTALCPGGGGTVRMDREITAVRARKKNVLLLDAGDQFLGTLFHTRYKGQVTGALLDFLEYDATVPGNHEFDHGPDVFTAYMHGMKTPMLAANLRLPNQSPAPWRIVERSGTRVGLIGLTTTDTVNSSAPGPETRFQDDEAALRVAVAALQAENVNHIVLISHVGLQRDLYLAAAVDGVDIIVGGHSHSFLSNNPTESEGKADGPYPLVGTSPSGKPVLIVTARYSGQLLGKLHVQFDRNGVPLSWAGEPIRLAGDENIRAEAVTFVDQYTGPLAAWATSPVGTIQAEGVPDGRILDLPDSFICRKQECLTGNVLADLLRASPTPDGKPIQIMLVNAGMIRQSLPAGKVSMADLAASTPFNNSLMVTTMAGSVILDALERSVSGWEDGKGRFLQVSGLKFVFDSKKPVGQRVVSASLVTNTNGKTRLTPINPRMLYRVGTLDFVAGGGDGFAMFKGHRWLHVGLDLELAAAVFPAVPITAKLDGRIVIQ